MQSSHTQLLRLSQGQLNVLETCPRKFQHIYFDQLSSPTSPEQQERQNWGSRFHLLMQQREMGLPVESLLEEDPQLQRWMTSLVSAAPEVFTTSPESFRQSEHCRTLNVEEYLLTVIYDLLIADNQRAQILDWKTYLRPKLRRQLEKDWQTRLYLYVMAETSDYLPEQISMTYWFVQSQGQPKSLKFTYDTKRHEQTRQDLTRLLTQLTNWLQRYQDTGEDFPQVRQSLGRCQKCNFALTCQRSPESMALARHATLSAASSSEWVLNLADIQEVSI